jgi:hypothetical protein
MAVKKIEELNIHRDVNSTEQFDVQGYLNENWDKMQDVVDNNAEELMQVQKDISTLKEDNKTNKSSIDVLEKSNETRDEKISKNVEDIEAIQRSIKAATETINKKDNEQDEDIKANKESIKEIQAENERLREDIKSIATIGEASGENIHIEDSSNARCEIEIGGNQQQDTREGYNQLKNEGTTQTLNNVTITKKEDETLVVNGTATEDFTFSIKRNIELEDGEQYKLSGCPNGGAEKKYALTINQYYENQSHFGQDYGDGVNFTYNGSLPINNNIYIRLFKGITYNNLIFKPMIVKGTEQKPYEQYGASPSIDYPSPVKSVGDNVNLFPGWEMGTIDTATGNKITDPYYIRSVDFIPTLPNIDYTIYSIDSFGFNSLNTALRLYDKDKKYLGSQYLGEILEKNLTFKITNLDARFMIPTSTNGQKNVIPGNAKVDIKLEKGIIATPYSSYNCGSVKIDIFNKNFIDIDKLKSLNSRNAYEKYNNVECLKLAGVTQRYNLNCKQNTQYVFQVNIVGYTYTSKLIGQFLIAYTDGSTSYMQTDGTNAGKYSLISKAGKTVKALVWNGYSSGHFAYIDKNDIQLDEATTLTNIVQHEEQSYLVDVQQEMLKGDTFVRKDGKWYEKHCVKTEIMLTFPTTNIEVCGTFANFQINRNIAFAVVKNDLKITNVRNDILCDKLKAKDNSMWGGKEDGIQTYINSNKFMISIPFEDIEKNFGEELTINNYSQAFRKYINDNGPFKIYYFLEEPKLLECTETQSKVLDEIYNKAHTYKNITNISAESSKVNPIASVKYLKDPETEHNKLQAQINEIKELLSSTETSSLLLDNIQKDLESEV